MDEISLTWKWYTQFLFIYCKIIHKSRFLAMKSRIVSRTTIHTAAVWIFIWRYVWFTALVGRNEPSNLWTISEFRNCSNMNGVIRIALVTKNKVNYNYPQKTHYECTCYLLAITTGWLGCSLSRHRAVYKVTWASRDKQTEHQIHQICIIWKLKCILLDVPNKRSLITDRDSKYGN